MKGLSAGAPGAAALRFATGLAPLGGTGLGEAEWGRRVHDLKVDMVRYRSRR